MWYNYCKFRLDCGNPEFEWKARYMPRLYTASRVGRKITEPGHTRLSVCHWEYGTIFMFLTDNFKHRVYHIVSSIYRINMMTARTSFTGTLYVHHERQWWNSSLISFHHWHHVHWRIWGGPLWVQILSISCSFCYILAKSYVGVPCEDGAPTSGKSWICHWIVG